MSTRQSSSGPVPTDRRRAVFINVAGSAHGASVMAAAGGNSPLARNKASAWRDVTPNPPARA